MNISEDSKIEIVHELLDLIKESKLDNIQKQTLYNIVMSLEDKTEKQKTRFIMYYKLDISQNEEYNLSSLGRYFKCTASAIKFSIIAVRGALIRLNDSRSSDLKDLLEQLKKQK